MSDTELRAQLIDTLLAKKECHLATVLNGPCPGCRREVTELFDQLVAMLTELIDGDAPAYTDTRAQLDGWHSAAARLRRLINVEEDT